MSENILKALAIAVIYLLVRTLIFKKSKKRKMSFRKRYEMKKKEKQSNEKN